MRKAMVLAVSLFVLACSASLTSAAIHGSGIEFGGYLTAVNYDNESNTENDVGLGGRFGLLFTDRHGLDLSFDFVGTEDDFGLGLDVDLYTFKAGYLYNFAPRAAVSPLLLVGAGVQNVKVSEETIFGSVELVDETDPLAYAGLGVRFFVTPVFNIRVEGQAVAVFPDGDPDDTLVDGVLNVGVGWVLGSR